MQVWPFKEKHPVIDPQAFVAPGAQIIGQVTLQAGSSVWHGAIIRGDMDKIIIGKNSNVQDNSVVHVSEGHPVSIGDDVTIGHHAVIHGCTIGNQVLVGMNATVLDGAQIGDGCIIGANALIPQGKVIPPHSMVLGIPGKVVKQISLAEREDLVKHALKYRLLWEKNYR